MTMPNMSGLELGRNIFFRQPQLPVILCTGYSRTINRDKALAEGFSRYIEKPMILADLTSAIQEVLAGETADTG
jgi:CheY-like chemotaxis protein